MLPLDLHVLSLSLAFILSQDQTLRCIYIVLSFSLEKTHDLLSKTTNLVEPVPHSVDVLRTIFIGERGALARTRCSSHLSYRNLDRRSAESPFLVSHLLVNFPHRKHV